MKFTPLPSQLTPPAPSVLGECFARDPADRQMHCAVKLANQLTGGKPRQLMQIALSDVLRSCSLRVRGEQCLAHWHVLDGTSSAHSNRQEPGHR